MLALTMRYLPTSATYPSAVRSNITDWTTVSEGMRTVMGRLLLPRVAGALVGAATAIQVAPAATWLPAFRRRFPLLAGVGESSHVALTFDDGPDPSGTHAVLDALGELDVRATFFVVGERLRAHPKVAQRCVEDGHEIAVHGWQHRYGFTTLPEARECVHLVEEVTGEPPLWFRPPYGVLTMTSLLDAMRVGLSPVLWTVWAREWRSGTTSADVVSALEPGLVGGATVLLHDSDAYSSPGTWRAVAEALPEIVERCRDAGLIVGPLRDHFPGAGVS